MFNEKEVINRILNGDMQAFKLIVEQYEKLVFIVLSRLIVNKEDVKDVCQDTFIKVYKNLSGFKFQSKLSTWIAKIAYFSAINYLKKHEKQKADPHSENLDNYYFTEESPERLTIKKDASAYINHLIEQLPLNYKTVLTLYHVNEFSYQEIEQVTGLPEGTVKGYLFRARKLLKEKSENYYKNDLT